MLIICRKRKLDDFEISTSLRPSKFSSCRLLVPPRLASHRRAAMKRAIYAVLLCYFFELLLSEVTVLNKVQYIYDKSPKVKIRGAGFEAADHDTIVDIGVSGEPPLVVDKDFTVYKSEEDSDNIILKLLGNRRYNCYMYCHAS